MTFRSYSSDGEALWHMRRCKGLACFRTRFGDSVSDWLKAGGAELRVYSGVSCQDAGVHRSRGWHIGAHWAPRANDDASSSRSVSAFCGAIIIVFVQSYHRLLCGGKSITRDASDGEGRDGRSSKELHVDDLVWDNCVSADDLRLSGSVLKRRVL